jgi:hypothetical protein
LVVFYGQVELNGEGIAHEFDELESMLHSKVFSIHHRSSSPTRRLSVRCFLRKKKNYLLYVGEELFM